MRGLPLLLFGIGLSGVLFGAEPVPVDPAALPVSAHELDFEALAEDDGWVAPVARDLTHLDAERAAAFQAWFARIRAWAPSATPDPQARVRALLVAAALTDIGRSPWEAETARAVFDTLQAEFPPADLAPLVATVAVGPVVEGPTTIPALDLTTSMTPVQVHARSAVYAGKLLGRLLHRITP